MKINPAQNKLFFRLASLSFAVALLAGCASAKTTVSNPYMGPQLPRPNRILVYDFTSNLNDAPSNSPLQMQLGELVSTEPMENTELSEKLGAQISNDVAAEIVGMGLPGFRAERSTRPQPGDLVFMGYFLTLDKGSATERMALGFGKGAAELKVTVEAYKTTDQGFLEFLGSGEGSAGSGKTPGGALSLGIAVATANPVGLIVTGAAKAAGEASGKETIEGASKRITKLIAERMQAAFERQGWI